MPRRRVRIKYVLPLPFGAAELESRVAQIDRSVFCAETEVVCVPARSNGYFAESPYEAAVLDMYLAEAALCAEAEGYDAVVMDTVSDSALATLRSRLSIPVIGPGLASYAVAMCLGKRFSIVTLWHGWNHLYQKNLDTYGLWSHCASIRSAEIEPDFAKIARGEAKMLPGEATAMLERLTEEAQKAIDEDGADVILLGSTTMHEAADYMSRRLLAPVINPGLLATKLAEALVQLGLSHSKVAWPAPRVLQDEKWFSLASDAGYPAIAAQASVLALGGSP